MKQERAGHVRPPAQAGRFYSADPQRLRREVGQLLAAAVPGGRPAPKAVIAPHAGYIYSGPVAASAHAVFRVEADRIRRVILMGPTHWADFKGVAAASATAFATPLGAVPVDEELVSLLVREAGVQYLDSAHAPEHSLEVHLPFLQLVLQGFSVVPLLVGRAAVEEVAQVLEASWDGRSTRLVISSDLSHYLDHANARARDAATAAQIKALSGDALTGDDACGYRAVRGLLEVARRRGLSCRVLDLRNSGDIAGGRHRVVGYGAFAIDENDG